MVTKHAVTKTSMSNMWMYMLCKTKQTVVEIAGYMSYFILTKTQKAEALNLIANLGTDKKGLETRIAKK